MAKKEYVKVGIGNSTSKDAYEAAVEAAKEALRSCGGKATFSIVYVNQQADPKKILKGINSLLGKNWIGISVDKMFNSEAGFNKDSTVSVTSLQTDYLHFGVGVADKYRKKPKHAAKSATFTAFKTVRADDHIDSYIQFLRTKKHEYAKIVKTPPYFILAYTSGAKVVNGKEVPGEEAEFVEGIIDYVGPHVPVFGGSASSDLSQYLEGKADNFQFAQGRLYRDAALVIFVISDLYYEIHTEHGYDMTKRFAVVTKVDESGYAIRELNHSEPVKEYARLLGLSKKQYLKNYVNYMFNEPFAVVKEEGRTAIKEVLPHSDQKTLHSNFKLQENAVLNVMKMNKKKTLHTMNYIFKKSAKRDIALGLFCVCSGRRPLIKDIEKKEVKIIQQHHAPFFGFFSFGEIGSSDRTLAEPHSQTVTALIINNTLITE
jgi:hypothetical protein